MSKLHNLVASKLQYLTSVQITSDALSEVTTSSITRHKGPTKGHLPVSCKYQQTYSKE